MSKLKFMLGAIILVIAIYFMARVLNVAQPIRLTLFILAMLGALFGIIGAILLRLRIVEYGQSFGHSALSLLFGGVGLLLMGIAGYTDLTLLLLIGITASFVGLIKGIQAPQAHNN